MIERNEKIEKMLDELAIKLNLEGSINVQLRMVENTPYVFEINPRFSSTVMFRHLFGFTDLLWCIQTQLGLSITAYSPPKENATFYKGFAEYISEI